MSKNCKVLGTIKRGKVKITSKKQIAYLHVHEIDHTHFVCRNGKIVRKVRHTY